MRVALALLLCAACSEPRPREQADETSLAGTELAASRPVSEPVSEQANSVPVSEPSETMLGTSETQQEILQSLLDANPTRYKPVGTSAIVLRASIGDGYAAFRPAQRARPRGHLAEVAAYRLSRLLGMDNVAPAITRTISLARIEDRWDSRFSDDLDAAREALIVTPGRDPLVAGAMIYWIPDMRQIGLDDEDQRLAAFARMRATAPLEVHDAALLADLSTLIAYDYLIGNWDRWSGHNAKGTLTGHRLFVRDHDLAFGTPLPVHLEERLLALVEQVERFSRSFVTRLRALDRTRLAAELALDPAGDVLTETQLRDLFARRAALLSYVDALIAQHGESRVLAFP